jgi:manganese transport protein
VVQEVVDSDPYARRTEYIRVPPDTFWARVKFLGPGLIIAGSIVGSGELIATTTLGAKVGFYALWMVIVSCLIKVVIQEELGRYTIGSGETALRALDRIPGRLHVSWVIWFWIVMTLAVTLQLGGIVGGVGQALHLAWPRISANGWTVIVTVAGIALTVRGYYATVERLAIFMVVLFTFITLACAVLVQWTPHAFTWAQFAEGLTLKLPKGGAGIALAVFGITGVGATELVMYPYWAVEKGYARFVGPTDSTEAWLARAKGWIRVMHVDIVVAMVVFTIATIAFYILGAAVLHGMDKVPQGYEMVATLSNMYTESIGGWALFLFLVGAFFVLFSTFFVYIASLARMATDCLKVLGLIDFENYQERLRWIGIFCVVFPVLYCVLYITFAAPVYMVLIGGVMQASFLPILGFSALYLRYKQMDKRILPGPGIDALMWVCVGLMATISIYAIYRKFGG